MASFRRDVTDKLLIAVLLATGNFIGVVEAQTKQPMLEQEVLTSEAFLSSHPDLMNRLRGFHELVDRKDPSRAASYFRRAARYADKTSQAMYAEMLWEGNGVKQDRPAAYAWMDLAAERGYEELLVVRERYWAALDAAERRAAIDIGHKVYAEYGDDVAKPRMNLVLQRALRKMTGSRTGSKALAGNLEVRIPAIGGGWIKMDVETFYRDELWRPSVYWAWKDMNIEGAKRGRVETSDIHDVTTKPAANRKAEGKQADPPR